MHIESRGFGQIVVGEYYYQKALNKCHKDKSAQRIDGRSVSVPVLLKLENDNPHDSNAVAIMSHHGMIGHLPREDAVLYRGFYGEDEGHSTICKVYKHDDGTYSAYLSLTITKHTSKRVLQRATPTQFQKPPKKDY